VLCLFCFCLCALSLFCFCLCALSCNTEK
jgi:hypothetical protein